MTRVTPLGSGPAEEASRLERAKRAWAVQFAGLTQLAIDDRVLGFAAIVRAIARSGALSPERFAEEMGLGVSRAKQVFADLAARSARSRMATATSLEPR